ncbi:hypothetical protein [Bradyrhizobium sp. CSA112]|uniref:hypothetical protein n=1 Tax=Bradyrhizobium sp. CSA112 TaxID=2699170 RepID=UPI0023AF9CAE|nr:hypothetical protein [Bradyrhizobium sp. CSA112]
MATNKPTSGNAQVALRKRIQLRTKAMGETTWTKPDEAKFIDQKKAPAKKEFKGIRREKKAG